jgi:hypothetical protein
MHIPSIVKSAIAGVAIDGSISAEKIPTSASGSVHYSCRNFIVISEAPPERASAQQNTHKEQEGFSIVHRHSNSKLHGGVDILLPSSKDVEG